MKKTNSIFTALLALTISWSFSCITNAQADERGCTEHDVERGECSVGTDAPSRKDMLSVIQSGSATKLMATLEYGERVECDSCVVPLMNRILTDSNPEVREFSAWWIRRRPFHVGYVMKKLKSVLKEDDDPTRRARAAAAIGEFLDPMGLKNLTDAAKDDDAGEVRAAAVAALGRLNHPGGADAIAAGLSDDDVAVRRAALSSVRVVNFFSHEDALLDTLADEDAAVRGEGALMIGQRRVEAGAMALAGLLRGDDSASVRRSAAWALGRLGTSEARNELKDAQKTESNSQVLNAIEIALKM